MKHLMKALILASLMIPAAAMAQPAADTPDAQAANDAQAKPATRKQPTTCTYKAYAWDTRNGRSTNHFTVEKPYAEVTDDERDPNAPQCTICSEDQVTIDPKEFGVSLAPIKICHAFAPQVREALAAIAASGEFEFTALEGYRPGRTRGPVDKNGLQPQFWRGNRYQCQ